MTEKQYTYRHMRNALLHMEQDQLSQPASILGMERGGGLVERLWIAEEDHINPSGDGIEPVSAYAGDDEFNADDEPVVVAKGSVMIEESERQYPVRRADDTQKLIRKIIDSGSIQWLHGGGESPNQRVELCRLLMCLRLCKRPDA